ncbi:MAG: glycosyltransferase family 4 protein [Candidatus Methylumidiphilus sp.]
MKPIFVYALHSGQLYGTERMALHTLDGLRDELTPVLFAPPGPALAEARRLGIETVAFANAWQFARRLRPSLAGHERIAFAATGIMHSLAFAAWNLFYRRRAVHLHLVHGGAAETLSYGRKRLLNGWPVRFVAVSEFVRGRLLAHGVRSGQISVVGNFLPQRQILAAPKRPRFDAPGIRRVAIVSRVEPVKRVDLLLDMLDRHPEHSDLQFRVFGGGCDLDALRRRAEAHPNVCFLGFSGEVDRQLAESDVLLHLCPAEPFGLVILEAMAAHLPVLVADTGGAAGLVDPAEGSGFHFRADDADDLARRLAELRLMPAEQINRVADGAAKRLDDRYSSAVGLRHYRNLFAEILG